MRVGITVGSIIAILFTAPALAQVSIRTTNTSAERVIEHSAERAFAAPLRVTAPCSTVSAAGAQGNLFGLTYSGSRDSMLCWYLEYFKTIMEAGDPDLAWAVLKQSSIVKGAIAESTNRPTIEYTYPTTKTRRGYNE